MSLRTLLESSFQRYLEKAVGGRVLTGLGEHEVEYPVTIAAFKGGEEIHPQAFTFRCEVMVTVIGAADPETEKAATEAHNELFNKVVFALEVEGLADLLMSAEPDLLVNGIESMSEEEADIEFDGNDQKVFFSTYTVRLIAGHR